MVRGGRCRLWLHSITTLSTCRCQDLSMSFKVTDFSTDWKSPCNILQFLGLIDLKVYALPSPFLFKFHKKCSFFSFFIWYSVGWYFVRTMKHCRSFFCIQRWKTWNTRPLWRIYIFRLLADNKCSSGVRALPTTANYRTRQKFATTA